MATQTDADIEKLRAEMQTLRSDISQISETLKSIASGYGEAAVAEARQSAEKVQKGAKERLDAAAHEIEEHPITATLSAFGVGLVLGMLFSRK